MQLACWKLNQKLVPCLYGSVPICTAAEAHTHVGTSVVNCVMYFGRKYIYVGLINILQCRTCIKSLFCQSLLINCQTCTVMEYDHIDLLTEVILM